MPAPLKSVTEHALSLLSVGATTRRITDVGTPVIPAPAVGAGHTARALVMTILLKQAPIPVIVMVAAHSTRTASQSISKTKTLC